MKCSKIKIIASSIILLVLAVGIVRMNSPKSGDKQAIPTSVQMGHNPHNDWAAKVTAKGGPVTLDMGVNYNPDAGPIGALAEAQMTQVKAIKTALEKR